MFSHLLTSRSLYFDRLEGHFQNYNVDRQNILRGSLGKMKVLDPYLHEVVASLYQIKCKSAQDRSHDELSDRDRYNKVRDRLIEYVQAKKESAMLDHLSGLNIWLRAFPTANNESEAQALLEGADKVEDFLLLITNFAFDIPDEVVNIEEKFKQFQVELADCFRYLPESDTLLSSTQELLIAIQQLYAAKKKDEMLEKVGELKALLHLKFS